MRRLCTCGTVFSGHVSPAQAHVSDPEAHTIRNLFQTNQSLYYTSTPPQKKHSIRGLAVVEQCVPSGGFAREDAVWPFIDGLVADALYSQGLRS